MTLYIPPGYGHVIHSLKLDTDAQPMAVTFGVKISPAVTTTTLAQDVTDACATIFHDDVLPHFSSHYSLLQTEMHYRFETDLPTDPTRVAVGALSGAGGSSDQPAPQNCAILIHKRTSHAGRRGRGRLYLPGPLEASVDQAGVIQPSPYLASLQTMANTWNSDIDGVADLDGHMWLLHSTTPAIPVPTDLPVPYEVTSLIVDPIIATQRRRLRK